MTNGGNGVILYAKGGFWQKARCLENNGKRGKERAQEPLFGKQRRKRERRNPRTVVWKTTAEEGKKEPKNRCLENNGGRGKERAQERQKRGRKREKKGAAGWDQLCAL
ncbi:MAG: hypothetical protein EYC68_07755 [Chloroflexota bacterium]|nr:MAG: hypothetical protein EYC68_07755 [Chloroflexota bacterium]